MTEPTPPPRLSKRRQAIYATLPLLLLLFCLGLVNLLPGDGVGPTAVLPLTPSSINPTIAISQDGSVLLATAPPPSPTTPATATFTPTPLPTLPPEAQIELLGPPDDSVLPADAPVSLFWTWPLDLNEGQRFVVYLLVADEERPLPPLTEPNMGSGYHAQLQPADLSDLGSEFRWQVRLESDANTSPLRASDTRTLRLLSPP